MDANGFILFGLICFVFVAYIIYALLERVKSNKFSKTHLVSLAILATILILFGGRLYFVDANESLAIAAAEGDISQVRVSLREELLLMGMVLMAILQR